MSDYPEITDEIQRKRPRHLGGVLTGLAHPYHWGSGEMRGAPSIPYGSSPIGTAHHGPVMDKLVNRGVIPDAGLELPGFQSVTDPQRGGGTAPGLVLHAWPGQKGKDQLDQLYSLGCFAVSRDEWPQFRQDLIDYQKQNNGSAYLNITPDGKAQISAAPFYGGAKGGFAQPQTPQAPQSVANSDVPPILQAEYGRKSSPSTFDPASTDTKSYEPSSPPPPPSDASPTGGFMKGVGTAAADIGAGLTARDDQAAKAGAESLRNLQALNAQANQDNDPSRNALAYLSLIKGMRTV